MCLTLMRLFIIFFFSSRRRHTRCGRDWSSDVCSSDLGRWPPQPDGSYQTHVVRRQRPEKEGPDDVSQAYRAEIVPLAMKVASEPETGKAAASLDLTRFSSWAKERQPARVVFGSDRRPETITASLILGTSITIRLRAQTS